MHVAPCLVAGNPADDIVSAREQVQSELDAPALDTALRMKTQVSPDYGYDTVHTHGCVGRRALCAPTRNPPPYSSPLSCSLSHLSWRSAEQSTLYIAHRTPCACPQTRCLASSVRGHVQAWRLYLFTPSYYDTSLSGGR